MNAHQAKLFAVVAVACMLLYCGCATPNGRLCREDTMRHHDRPGLAQASHHEEEGKVFDLINAHARQLAEAADNPERALKITENLKTLLERLKAESLPNPKLTAVIEQIDRNVGRIHCRLKHVVDIDTAFTHMYSSDDLEVALDHAVEAQRRCRVALDEPGLWNDANRHLISEFERDAAKNVILLRAQLVNELSARIINEAKTPEAVEQACDKVIEAMDLLLADGRRLLSPTEIRNLSLIRAEFAAAKKQTSEDFAKLLVKAEAELLAQRRAFCIAHATADLGAANGILRNEDGKRFNWRILGRPRDNFDDLVRAARLCNRVYSSPMVADELRCRATAVRDSILSRFNRKEIARFNNYPSMPGYHTLAGYPNWDVRAAALNDWQFQRQPPAAVETIGLNVPNGKVPSVPIAMSGTR